MRRNLFTSVSNNPQSVTTRRFYAVFVGTLVGLYLALAVFVGVVDPYGLLNAPRIPGLTASKFKTKAFERVSKFYQVRNRQPKAIILGSSRANVGLRPSTLKRYAGTSYSLALNAATIQEIKIVFDFALRETALETAVLAVDIFSFQGDGADQKRLPELRNRAIFSLQSRFVDFAKHSLSFNALRDAIYTIFGNIRGWPPSHNEDGMFVNYLPGELTEYGTAPILFPIPEKSLAAFEAICEAAAQRRIDLKMFVSPVYRPNRDIEANYDDWLEKLRVVAKRYGFSILDFRGRTDIAREKSNFIDGSHFVSELGDKFLAEIFATPIQRAE